MSGRGRAEGATSGGREGRILLGREKSPCTVIVGEVAGEDVPCLHAYPGYAANWKRPTNDTRTGIRSGPRLLPSDQSTPTIWSQRLRAAGFEGTFRACFSRAKLACPATPWRI